MQKLNDVNYMKMAFLDPLTKEFFKLSLKESALKIITE